MNKSMIQIVAELTAKGHNIKYSIRKDGGILIRSIDGEHFYGAKGNARARAMVGATLSKARSAQLQYATRARMRPVRTTLSERVQQAFERVKKLWRKAFKAKGGKPHPAGYFSKRHIKYVYKQYGEEKALELIAEAERYATGIAYSKNVQHLADYIKMAGTQYESEELNKLADDILLNAHAIKEEWIYLAYQALYDLNTGKDPKEVAQKVRRILRL